MINYPANLLMIVDYTYTFDFIVLLNFLFCLILSNISLLYYIVLVIIRVL